MSVADTLRAARAKVAQGWTQGAAARNAAGHAIRIVEDEAASWCAVGAIFSLDGAGAEAAMRALEAEIGRFRSIISWNDRKGRTQAEVLAAFDKAIAAESEGT